jgi:hypothetical protein
MKHWQPMVEPYFVTDIAAAASSKAVTLNTYYFATNGGVAFYNYNIVVTAHSVQIFCKKHRYGNQYFATILLYYVENQYNLWKCFYCLFNAGALYRSSATLEARRSFYV